MAIAFATASPSGVTTSTSQFTNVLPRRNTRPIANRSVARAGARNCMEIDVVTPRSESGTSAPAQAAAIAAIAPPCTMSAIVTLVGSHGRRSLTSSVSRASATMPSLATNGEDGMNWAMTSAPVWGWVGVVMAPLALYNAVDWQEDGAHVSTLWVFYPAVR